MRGIVLMLLVSGVWSQAAEPYMKQASRTLRELSYTEYESDVQREINKIAPSALLPTKVLKTIKGLARIDYPASLPAQHDAVLFYKYQYLLTQQISKLSPPPRMPRDVFVTVLNQSEGFPVFVSISERYQGKLSRVEYIFAECDAFNLLLEAGEKPGLGSFLSFQEQYREYAKQTLEPLME